MKFSLATSKRWRNRDGEKQEKTTWHSCICFQEGLAKVIESYVNKGDLIAIQGEIENRSYEKDGDKRWVSEVIIQDMEMLGSKDAKQEGPTRQDNPEAQPGPSFARDELNDKIPF